MSKRGHINRPVLCGRDVSGAVNPLELVDPDIDLKGKTIRPYSIAHKGRIAPTIRDEEGTFQRILTFSDKALRHVLDQLPLFTKAVDQHKDPSEANLTSQGNRPTLAQVVGKGLKRINGKAHAIAVLAFNNPADAQRFPGISMESKRFHFGGDKIVRFIEKITNLALLPEGVDPAFPDAGAKGAPVLCSYFEGSGGGAIAPGDDQGGQPNMSGQGTMAAAPILGFEQLRDGVRSTGRPASAFFDSHSVIGTVEFQDGKLVFDGGDPAFTRVISKRLEGKVILDAAEVAQLKEQAEQFGKIKEPFEKMRRKEAVTVAKTEIPKLAEKRGVSDRARDFLLDEVNLRALDLGDDPTKGLETYIDQRMEDFKGLVERGIIAEDDAGSGSSSQSSPQGDGQTTPQGGGSADGQGTLIMGDL